MRALNFENQNRKNIKMEEMYENYQSNRVERIDAELARSQIGPALLWQIQKKNKQTKGVLFDLAKLDDKLQNPQKYEQQRKEMFYDFKKNKLQFLSTYADESNKPISTEKHLSPLVKKPMPHATILERCRP